ncbi:MAG: diaminopimelate epimerase [Gammaproteobacteria bacterium]|nr:diaminopimelate epimerase [Gammaproteobacteria bacterium]
MANLQFTKMHGLGNDFIVIATDDTDALPTATLWRALADRHTGIGFDQALVILPPRQTDATAYYRIFNADGSESEQCGNGVRCVAEWLRLQGRTNASALKLDSLGGRVEAKFVKSGVVAVNMGVPRFTSPGESTLQVDEKEILFTEISIGVPHIVLQVSSVDEAPVSTLGARLESHQRFPQRTNVGFLEVIDRAHARLRVFERGVGGETRACGTGACAAMASARRQGLLEAEAEIALPGGALQLRWQGEGSNVWMTGPAAVVFSGEVDLSQLA